MKEVADVHELIRKIHETSNDERHDAVMGVLSELVQMGCVNYAFLLVATLDDVGDFGPERSDACLSLIEVLTFANDFVNASKAALQYMEYYKDSCLMCPIEGYLEIARLTGEKKYFQQAREMMMFLRDDKDRLCAMAELARHTHADADRKLLRDLSASMESSSQFADAFMGFCKLAKITNERADWEAYVRTFELYISEEGDDTRADVARAILAYDLARMGNNKLAHELASRIREKRTKVKIVEAFREVKRKVLN